MKQIRALRSSKEFQLILAITACNGLPFVLAPAKAAALGPADRGHFAYFQAALLIMINISVFGARWSVYKNRLDGPQRLTIARRPLLTTAAPVAAIAGGITILAQPDLPSSTQFGLLALIVAAPLYTLFQVELAHAQIAFIPGRILLLSAAPVLVDFVASAIFLAAGRFTIQAVVIVALTAEASRLFLSLHLRRRDRRIDVFNSSARDDLAQVAAFWPDSLKFSVPSAAPIIASNIDVLILGIFVRPAQLGIYAVAKIGFNLTQLAGQAIEGRALVNLRNGPRAKEFRATLGAFVVLASLIALAGAAAVLTLFPDSFSPAAPIVPALVLAGVVFTIIRWVVASLATEGGNARLSWYSSACILGSSVLAPAAIMFMPDRGVTSMALLALAAQLASAASTAVLVRFVAARQRVSS